KDNHDEAGDEVREQVHGCSLGLAQAQRLARTCCKMNGRQEFRAFCPAGRKGSRCGARPLGAAASADQVIEPITPSIR
ncbi:hypothetical protein MXD81_21260, partial [Microbacteriaceae bacterium K1510]|nr:hypothetical protein [Microbacteriaceae bacterium K1510]